MPPAVVHKRTSVAGAEVAAREGAVEFHRFPMYSLQMLREDGAKNGLVVALVAFKSSIVHVAGYMSL